MKKFIFGNLLAAGILGILPAIAQTESGITPPELPPEQPVVQGSVATGDEETPLEATSMDTLSRKEKRKLQEQVEGEVKFSVAKAALEGRSCVIEIFDARSTAKTRACYNYVVIQGDSIVMQAAWPGSPTYGRGGHTHSEGTISRLEMTPDKKGNINVKIDASMQVTDFGISYGTWLLNMRFKLFQGSNRVSLIANLEGYIVLPSQANIVQMNGPVFPHY